MTHDSRPATSPVFIQCASHGCSTGLAIRPEHADHFDSRNWTCGEHQTCEVPC